jgi:hypothetical protein
MASRGLVIAALLAGAGVVGCGGNDGEVQAVQQAEHYQAARAATIRKAVDDGRLPPVTLDMLRSDNSIRVSFIDGPNGVRDVVHTQGAKGAKLRWDLNQDGTIERSERTITEQELYNATVRLR